MDTLDTRSLGAGDAAQEALEPRRVPSKSDGRPEGSELEVNPSGPSESPPAPLWPRGAKIGRVEEKNILL